MHHINAHTHAHTLAHARTPTNTNTHTTPTRTQNPRHKQYGFDVLTEEEKNFYPLAADSDAEMEDWIDVLNRAIGLEVEELGRAGELERTWGRKGCWCDSVRRELIY